MQMNVYRIIIFGLTLVLCRCSRPEVQLPEFYTQQYFSSAIPYYDLVGHDNDIPLAFLGVEMEAVDSVLLEGNQGELHAYCDQEKGCIHISGYYGYPAALVNLTLWVDGYPVSYLLRNSASGYVPLMAESSIRLAKVNHTRRRVMISYNRPVEQWFIYCGKFRIPDRFYSSGNGVLTLYIPVEAQSVAVSELLIAGSDGVNFSNTLRIPLHFGLVADQPE
ncbi:MAG: hypothetical protein EOL88_05575 [Bacteroidia bacterium]|nr:hypothetical protein [Bacteroidales bacterium]NCD41546.1 hypothetical protein [Bacteroidia bacterium]